MTRVETIGERLRHGRRRLGWNQAELARAAGVGPATVKRAEAGATAPHPGTARKLAAALGVRVAWLTVGEPPMLEGKEG